MIKIFFKFTDLQGQEGTPDEQTGPCNTTQRHSACLEMVSQADLRFPWKTSVAN